MSPRPHFQGVSPILLSAGVDLLVNNAATPNSGLLSYPFRKATIIEEIRWTIRRNQIIDDPAVNMQLGALVYVKMALGRHLLMRDAVPVWLLGTTMSFAQEEASDSTLGLDGGSTNLSLSHYRWRLPEPLYVDAGEVLTSTFSRGIDGFGTFNVQVSYVGRTVAPNQPRPKVIAVPFAAPFVTTLGRTYQQSNEAHLFNIFDRELRIQRLTGRVLSFVSAETCTQLKVLTPLAASLTSSITLLMKDSWGGKMVNNQTGPSDVFDSQRAAWTVDYVMPPKGMYEVQVWNIPAAQQLHVAMVGVREEAL